MPTTMKPLMRRETASSEGDNRGRYLVATSNIDKGQLIFAERPMIVMQSTGNSHTGALVCSYCFSFCGAPQQCLEIACNPMSLQSITTTEHPDQTEDLEHALIPCRHKCGHVYCSEECQHDDWEYGGHKELCTGWITDENEEEHPLVSFKKHAVETNEIFLIIGQWLARILKQNVPYNDDDNLNTHPYTDFMMNPWWDVNTAPLRKNKDPMRMEEAIEVEQACKRLCEESCKYLRQAWPEYADNPWLTPLGLAKLIGSLEQNCVGVRRKHAIRQNIMEDQQLRNSCHAQIIRCLENAGMIGDANDGDDHGECVDGNCSDPGCCTDEEAINEDVSEASVNKKYTPSGTTSEEAKSQDDGKIEVEGEWEYSHDEIATFLAGLEVTPDFGRDDTWDEVFIPLDGTAHFSIATKMNHSCEPNVVILYNTRGWGSKHPLVAQCVALRDIQEGEELTISYITSDDSYEDRQTALENYGFICTCPKCEREIETIADGDNNNICTAVPSGANESEGEDNDDLFGGDSSDDDDDDDDDEPNDDEEQTGDARLTQLATRLESWLNQTEIGRIPLTYLAPASNHVIHNAKDFLADMRRMNGAERQDRAVNLASKCATAIQSRDFALCRIVGVDLESHLFGLLKSNGSFPDPSYRKAYWCAAITAAIGYAQEGSFLLAMNYLDKSLMLGQSRSAIEGFFSYVELFASQMALGPCPPDVTCKLPTFQEEEIQSKLMTIGLSKPISSQVEEFTGITEEFTLALLKDLRIPVVVRSLASDWPATTNWRDIGGLVRNFGHRLVPIEVGSMSSSTGMKEELVSFRQFVSQYISPSSEKLIWSLKDATTKSKDSAGSSDIAYLAQHPLLDQIQALFEDVDTKPCGITPTNINAWMGTGGTRTPLHFDSYDNLFIQLVGVKYVRLYDTNLTNRLYVSNNKSYGLQGNMSDVDCEMEDYDKFPLLKDCPYTEVLMRPGDCLFIPSRHWHYVRSLSTSISVNYWF